ncbi:MAG: DUF6531 domain-containing protein, partial [Dehalococcoidia bacterium]
MSAVVRRLLLAIVALTAIALLGSTASLLHQPQRAEATTSAAVITAPANGSTLPGASVSFSWTPGASSTTYVLWLGNNAGGSELFNSPTTTATSMTPFVTIPANGRPVYARLWSFDAPSSSWLPSDSSYTAAPPPAGLATLSSPIAGATLAGASQTFTWTAAPGATGYQLYAGSTLGNANEFYSALLPSSTTSIVATGLPTDGSPVFIRLLTQLGSEQPVDYVFTAAGGAGARPGVVSLAQPVAGQSGLTQTPTLMWSAPSGAVPGTTTYTVHYATANPPATTLGSQLAATTALWTQVPASARLAAGASYAWTVVACNGSACTTSGGTAYPLGSWWPFSVAASSSGTAPAAVTQAAPADGSQNTGTTPTLSWATPVGAIAGLTQYSVILHDAPGGGGNALTPLPATTATSQPVPAQVLLLPSHTYSWNIVACTGLLCSVPSATWWSFATGTLTPGTPGVVAQQSPADGASASGTTPTLSWLAPSGAIPGTTTYTVSLWDPTPAPSGTLLAPLAATTSLSTTVSFNVWLVNGHSYHWNVTACNGASCSGFASHWFAFSTAAPPGVVSLGSPANGASNQSRTPYLSWSTPANFISGVTRVFVSVWDPYAPPAGHRLGDISCTGSCSNTGQLPLSEGLLYGQSYAWNVYACNGEACSGYAASWSSFTTMNQPAVTLSGATVGLLTGDFSGPNSAWAGDGTYTNSGGFSYRGGVTAITSLAANPGAYRFGYATAPGVTLTVKYGSSAVFTDSTATGQWTEAFFTVPASLGNGQTFSITSSTGASIAYLQPLSLPSGFNTPRLSGDSRLPKAVGATDGGGVDVVTGAFASVHTDLALPGVSGTLAFTRAYDSAAVTEAVTGPPATIVGPLGPKWTHNWQYAVWTPDANTVVLQVPGGQTFNFVANGSSYVSQAGADATFVQDNPTTGHWTLTTAGQVQYGFSSVAGVLQLTTMRDRNLNTTTLGYDSSHRLTSVTDAGGRYLSLGYSSGNAISSVSDSAGRTVHYAYDPTSGDLSSVTDVLGGVTAYGYGGGPHLLTQITDPLNTVVLKNSYDPGGSGKVTTQTDATNHTFTFGYGYPGAGATTVWDQRNNPRTYYYDAAWRITDVLDAYGNRLSNSYDSDNNKASIENQLGGALTSTFDANGNLLTLTDAWNYTWYFTYDQHNNRLGATDPLNHLTQYTYDTRGNRLTTTDALNETATYTVNGLGQLTAVQDPRGYSGSFGYNSSGDRTTATDPLNHTSTAVYDSAGRPTSVTDALNHTVSATYNAANEVLTQSASPSSGVTVTTTYTYDLDGRELTVTDPNNHATSYAYDVRGLLSTVTDANTPAGVTTYGYDAAGNRTSVTDAKNQTTSYSFDNDNRPLTVTDPQTNVLYTLSYDAAGRVATRTDGKNQTTSFSYTLRGQLDHLTYPDSSTVQYQYDALGNRASMVDPTGTTSYAYDALSRLSSVTFPGSKTVGYGYDADGNRASITYPGGSNQVSYGYDSADRLTSVTDWTSKQTSYAYDAANRLTTTTLPATNGTNNVTSSYSYDNANRL